MVESVDSVEGERFKPGASPDVVDGRLGRDCLLEPVLHTPRVADETFGENIRAI